MEGRVLTEGDEGEKINSPRGGNKYKYRVGIGR